MRARREMQVGRTSRWQHAVAALAGTVALVASSPAVAQTDFSLRIGTFNTFMLPGPGEGIPVAATNCGGVPGCWTCPPGVNIGPFFDNGLMWCEIAHPMYSEDQILQGAESLASRILHSGYDVIALNEVWFDGPRTTLSDALIADYPNQILAVGNPFLGPVPLPKNHSGLALFSKLPFESLPQNYKDNFTSYKSAKAIANGQVVDATDVLAYREFDQSEFSDEFASKGLAYVRLRNPDTGRIHNVFWTHTQATYLEEVDADPATWQGLKVRESQLQQFVDMLEAGEDPNQTSAKIQRTREDIFLLGDLNIDGDLSNPEDNLVLNGTSITPYGNLGEWSKYFGPGSTWNNGIFSTDFVDAWAREHPIADTAPNDEPTEFGNSYPASDCTSGAFSAPGCRFDYMVHNTPTLATKLCNQHTHLAFNLDTAAPIGAAANPPGGRGNLSDGVMGQPSDGFRSDHVGVMSNFNALEPQCSPLSPDRALGLYGSGSYGVRTLSSSEIGNTADGFKDYSDEAKLLSGALVHPGSVQWWRVTAPGTYLVGFTESSANIGYRAEVFASSSLSVPVHSYRDDFVDGKALIPGIGIPLTVTGKVYIFDSPPYYIKVFHPVHNHLAVPQNASGAYSFAVRRLGCTNKIDDACPLLPNTPLSLQFPGSPIDSQPSPDSLYFRLHVEPLTVPDAQEIQLVAYGYPSDHIQSAAVGADPNADLVVVQGSDALWNAGFDSRLAQEGITTGSSGLGTPCPSTGPMGVPELPRCNNRITWEHPQPAGNAQQRFWRISRTTNAPPTAFPVSATWTTELTALYGKALASDFDGILLVCKEETSDGSPHDEIGMQMRVDFVDMPPSDPVFIADFEQGLSKFVDTTVSNFTGGQAARYKQEVYIKITEEDNFSWQYGGAQLSVLPRNSFGPNSAQASEGGDWWPDDGHYTMQYLLSHGTQRFE